MVLGLIAIADLLFIAYLRQRRRNALRNARLMRSLSIAIKREAGDVVMPANQALARGA